MWESDAIIRYVAARYSGGTLWPVDSVERSRADQWKAWSLAHLYGDSNRLFRLTVRTPAEVQDAGRIARVRERVTARYRVLDQPLSKNEYIAGEHFTMGDIPAGATLYRYFNLPIERKSFSNLARWHALLQVRAPYQRHVVRGASGAARLSGRKLRPKRGSPAPPAGARVCARLMSF